MKKIGRLIYRHLKKNLFILGILLSITGVILGLFVPKVIGQFLDRHFLVDLLDHPIKLIGYLSLFILINVIKVFGNYLICRVGNLAIKKVQVTIYSDLLHSEVSALDHFQSGDIAKFLVKIFIFSLSTIRGVYHIIGREFLHSFEFSYKIRNPTNIF